jgi:hypothetical protein
MVQYKPGGLKEAHGIKGRLAPLPCFQDNDFFALNTIGMQKPCFGIVNQSSNRTGAEIERHHQGAHSLIRQNICHD